MKTLIGIFIFFLGLQGRAAPEASHLFPRIEAEQGKSSIRQKGEPLKGPRLRRALRESVLVETGPEDLVRIALSPQESVVVGPQSRALLPAIDWETGRVEEIELLQGRIFLDLQQSRRLRSALFLEDLSPGRYEFIMDPEKAEMTALVLTGELSFRGLETEQRSLLRGGETQVFRGELENGQMQYDVLLQGRKVARGKLLPKSSLSPAEMLARANTYQIREPVRKSKQPKRSAVASEKKSGLCQKPSAVFNQCVWTCEGNPKKSKVCQAGEGSIRCVRRRCLANGQWGDDYVYPAGKSICSARTEVRACDY